MHIGLDIHTGTVAVDVKIGKRGLPLAPGFPTSRRSPRSPAEARSALLPGGEIRPAAPTLGYEEAVALALAELEQVIANDDLPELPTAARQNTPTERAPEIA